MFAIMAQPPTPASSVLIRQTVRFSTFGILVQADTLQLVVASGKLGTVTYCPSSRDRALPKRPVVKVPPVMSPLWPLPDVSWRTFPPLSSQFQCATSPSSRFGGGGGCRSGELIGRSGELIV